MRILPLVASLIAAAGAGAQSSFDWAAYGHDAGGTRFSPLAQIDTATIARLRPVWIYRTGDLMHAQSRFEDTPLFVDGTLYIATPLGRVSAVDPETGAERWTYDPKVSLAANYGDFTNRGVSFWTDGAAGRWPAASGAAAARADDLCARRIFVATVDARLIALDAATGRRCDGFGRHGTVKLDLDLVNPPAFPGEYEVTSPPAIVGDLVIVGSSIGDNNRTNAPSGKVRAYDARTGALRWTFDPIPRTADDSAWETWRGPTAHQTGAANAWSVLSADTARGLVFVPVGSASPDFYGGERLGMNRYANSVVALRAATGRIAWSFQVVHHDLWDYDVPAQPVAFTWKHDGRDIPALAVATKMGHLFLLDRRDGHPLIPVRELPVPRSRTPGEEAWPTQPFPPPAWRFAPESLTASQAFGLTPESRKACAAKLAALDAHGIFTPSSTRGTIHYPGHVGGFNWSGVSVDEADQLMVAPVNALAMAVTLIPSDMVNAARDAHPGVEINRQRGAPYGMMREILAGPDNVPCNPPPWGSLVAFDLARGVTRWRIPLGALPGLEGKGYGTPSLGGVLLTRGGLAFVAGTLDHTIRAFRLTDGREVWKAPLPVNGHALPMTYQAGGRQYIVVAAGGHDRLTLDHALGDWVLAWALDAAPPDTTAHPIAGVWTGDLRVEDHERFPVTMRLTARGDSLTGTAAAGDSAITGRVVAYRSGRALSWRFAFTYPAKKCQGLVTAHGSEANGGTLLVGTLTVHSNCGDRDEPGTWSVRRP